MARVLQRRIDERVPAAYLTHEAWLGDFRFYVDERVIVPRSYIAELLRDELESLGRRRPASVGDALDLCTGSGCLAILLALAFPDAQVDATELSRRRAGSRDAQCRGLRTRRTRPSVHAAICSPACSGRYDLIVSNPPYVNAESMAALAAGISRRAADGARAAGEDGLDIVRRHRSRKPARI